MKKKIGTKILAVILAAGMAASLWGCGGNNNGSGDSNRKDPEEIAKENQVQTAEDEEAGEENAADTKEEAGNGEESGAGDAEGSQEPETGKKTEYPLTITTYGSDGTELTTTYEKAPQKVLAVYQGSVETLLALGLEDHIAAAAGLDNEVPEEQKPGFTKINYLDEFTPSLETVTMLEPDLIFSWGSLFGEKTLGDAKGWVEKGTNIYMNTNTHPKNGDVSYQKTLENEYTDILNIGKIFDVQEKAEAIVKEMQDVIADVKEQTKGQEDKPSVLILESYDDGFTNYNAESLGGDMVTQLGGVLANPDGGSIGKEDVIAANPDVIFVVYMPYSGDDPEQLKQEKLNVILGDEAYASLDAVKNNRVVPIMLSEMYASATRTMDGIVTFAKGLYPDLEISE